MAWHAWGNQPFKSTQTATADPSTTTLIAEIGSLQSKVYGVRWVVGGSTLVQWSLELASSTNIASTAQRDITTVFTPTNQSGEYLMVYKAELGDILRARVASSFTGTAAAKIEAEPLL